MQTFLNRFGFVFLFLAYALLRLWQIDRMLPCAGAYDDTANYIKTAAMPLLSIDFFGAVRPFMTPLLFKIAALNPVWIGWLQGSISILCWGFLAYQVTTFIKNPKLRVFGFIFLLLFSMVYSISGWDIQLLSESLALSFQAFLIGTFFWLLRGWAWHKVFFAGVAAFFWSNTRDANPWMLMGFAVVILLVGIFVKPYRQFIYLSIIFTAVFLFSQWSVDYSHRWVLPYDVNVLHKRILMNNKSTKYFEACGMVLDQKEKYQAWLYARGKYCFLRWLLADPQWALTMPLNDWNIMLGFDPIEQYDYFPKELPTLLPRAMERILYPAPYGFLFWWVGGIVAGLMCRPTLKDQPATILSIVLFLLVYPFIFLNWHTDVMEIGRHAIQTQSLMFFSFWLMVLFLLDNVLDKFPLWFGKRILQKETAS